MIRLLNGLILYPCAEKFSKRDITTKLNLIEEYNQLSASAKEEFQKKQLYDIALYSKNYIPYYKELFEQQSFDIENLKKDMKFVQDLPILTKEIIREHGERMKSSKAWHGRKTGGSTGQSVWFFYDDPGLDWTAAINQYAYQMSGKQKYHVDCHISADLGIAPPLLKQKIIQQIKLLALNRKVLLVRSFNDEHLNKVFKKLKSFSPYLLQGHPSSAYAIANYVESHNIKLKKPLCKIFEPSGEMLTEKMVNKIEKHLGCKVVNRYGNAEFGVIAHSTLTDSFTDLKVFDRAFYVEETERSNIIVTSLTNYGMPLFRYDTGDIATVRREGSQTYLSNIEGRIHDVVEINKQNYPTHYIMDFLDHKVGNVREFQILTKKNQLPKLNIVLEPNASKDEILMKINQEWPAGLDLDFIPYENLITQGWRQKFRHVINLDKS